MRSLLAIILLLSGVATHAANIRGKVTDVNNEALVGATVVLEGNRQYAIAGLDGSYLIKNVEAGKHTITISFVGFKSIVREIEVGAVDIELSVSLEADQTELQEVVVSASAENGSDLEARTIEKTSGSTMNIISAKAISLSPDVSVANVVQRVSGLSVERNSNGDPQYAIVRGMDKRYSYTLVNGIKIPSPDNKNRYIPLDIFPASLLERLEVYKSLTADQEADAIGGGVNMVMKNAPEHFELKSDLQLGYNYVNVLNGFNRYNAASVRTQTPRDLYGPAYQAQVGDFSRKNLEVDNIKPLPDVLASLSAGNRYFNDKLGVMIGGSFQNSYRGTKSLWFDFDTDRFGSNLPSLRSVQDRYYSTQQMRGAIHGRIDYNFNRNNKISLYSGYYKLINHEAREIKETYLDGRGYSPEAGDAILSYSTRTKTTDQGIVTNSLQGNHTVASSLKISWSAVYSQADNSQPDNARFVRNGELSDFVEKPQNVERRNSRQWISNNDRDLTQYLNITIQPASFGNSFIKIGGLNRIRERDANFNRYLFDPSPSLQVQGKDWNTYSDVTWSIVNPLGSSTDENNYKAHENIVAGYVMGKAVITNLEITGGLRAEHTDQGYSLKYPAPTQRADSSQVYTDVLPSLAFKYILRSRTNLRLTYFKGISRPGYFEIVPYQLEDDGYKDIGNPGLKRVRSDNVDLRWEHFPSQGNQFLVGVFYKRIKDPIEYVVVRAGVNPEPVQQPNNFGIAHNMGVEVDYTHYFNRFGVRANYTYTHSSVTSNKVLRTRENPDDPSSQLVLRDVSQTRPLQGQAKHIGNFSLLYKDQKKGWESQLSMVYTGERLEAISPFLDNDMYTKPIVIVDFALEKKVSRSVDVFLKATNLLNSSYEVYIKKPVYQEEGNTITYPFQPDPQHKTLVRKDQYYQSLRIGARILLNRN